MSTWRRFVPWACAGLLLAGRLSAQEPQVRASLSAKDETYVGQRVVLVVELIVVGTFASAATFDLPETPGLLLLPPTGSPLVSTEDLAGTPATVQRHELTVVPRRAGTLTIPPLTARFSFKRQVLDREAVPAQVRTTPLNLTVRIPPGAEKLGSVLSARDVKVEEVWKPAVPGAAKAGDAFTRTITYSAPDVPAMAFPPFPNPPIDGLRVYPKAPEVEDQSDRGSLQGRRRDTIVYTCQRPGEFLIPAVRWSWFDLESKQLRTIDLPARPVRVAANPALASAPAPSTAAVPRGGWLAALLAGAGLAFALWRTRARWTPLLAPLRPLHLAPLNPPPSQHSQI